MAARESEDGKKQTQAEEEEERKDWDVENNWGFSLHGIFGLALKFFKEMNGKAFNPTYEENLLFVALQKQIFLGPYNPKVCPEVGFFDILGADRRKKWAELGSTAKDAAMQDFVKLLNSCCSQFSPYVTCHKIEKEEQEKRIQQDMVAFNTQTPGWFQQNAESQKQLFVQRPQEQHSQEFIQQAHNTHQLKQRDTAEDVSPDSNGMTSDLHPINQSESSQNEKSEATPKQFYLFLENKAGELPIMAPSMWTMSQVNEFKEKTQQDAESVISVGRGEVLTVHVPTHEDGSTFFWEFATDDFDIAFGLYFEWSNTVNGTRHENVVDSRSEHHQGGRTEESTLRTSEKETRNFVPWVSEVVPVFRRDSHENVYAGSHQYPSQGVYLLRFDNSYSLWRSKVVYYRVYYTS